MVPPVVIVSSSGWAWTNSSRARAAGPGVGADCSVSVTVLLLIVESAPAVPLPVRVRRSAGSLSLSLLYTRPHAGLDEQPGRDRQVDRDVGDLVGDGHHLFALQDRQHRVEVGDHRADPVVELVPVDLAGQGP